MTKERLIDPVFELFWTGAPITERADDLPLDATIRSWTDSDMGTERVSEEGSIEPSSGARQHSALAYEHTTAGWLHPSEDSLEGRLEYIEQADLPFISITELESHPGHEGEASAQDSSRPASTQRAGGADLKVLDVLGEGGMGRVLLARQRSLRRKVAIKSLMPGRGQGVAARVLCHEGQIMGTLAHPSIPPLHALGRDHRDLPVLVMKHIDGVSWQELIREPDHRHWGRLTPSKKPLDHHLEIFMAVCRGMSFAHSRHVIHRDLKPANVMIGDFGEVYVIDWGLAERMGEKHVAQPLDWSTTTQTSPLGTPVYMAPEMLSGDSANVDERTDVYLLGAMLHEVLTGCAPHQGPSLKQVMHSVYQSLPRDYPPEVPQRLAAICRQAMSADMGARFSSASELHKAVATYLQCRGSLELTGAADEKLGELEAITSARREPSSRDDADESVSHEFRGAYAASQFAYLQALREWPDNQQAQAGLQRSIELMCHMEIDLRQLDSAGALIKRLRAPSEALVGRLDSARAEMEQDGREQEELRQLRSEIDLDTGVRPKLHAVAGLGLAFLILIVVGLSITGLDYESYGYRESLVYDLVALALYMAVLVWKRRLLFGTRADRSFFLLIGACFVSAISVRLVAWRMGLELCQSLTMEMISLGWLYAAGGVMLKPWLFWCALISLIAFSGLVLLPAFYLDIYYIGAILSWALIIIMFTRTLSRREKMGEAKERR